VPPLWWLPTTIASGNPEPSAHDVDLTRQLSEGAAILGMQVLDHVVVGDGAFVSLLERRLLVFQPRTGTGLEGGLQEEEEQC
jgi:hypothetical protein